MKIGVFDSGIGGLSVAQAIEKALPEHEVVFRNDTQHVPYGDKPIEEIYSYITPIFKQFEADGMDAVVVACNTVSTNLLEYLRELVSVPLIGVEPLVKLASEMTTTGIIAVCATPATLQSWRYYALKQIYATEIQVLEPDCSQWARWIEADQMDYANLHTIITNVIEQAADVIVLGCTHYHWIEEEILAIAKGRAAVIHPEPSVIEELKQVLRRLA